MLLRCSLVLLAVGCAPEPASEVQGVVVVDWDPEAPPAADVTVEAFSLDGERLAATQTAENGWFRLPTEPGVTNLFVVDGPGMIPAVFAGNPGLNPRFRIPNGLLFAVTESRWATELERWEGCPGVEGDPARALIAELYLEDFTSGDDGEPIRVERAFAELLLNDGRTVEPCYLGEDGQYSPQARMTGPHSALFVGDLPEGGHLLEVTHEPVQGGLRQVYTYPIYRHPGALVPQVPLLVPLGLEP